MSVSPHRRKAIRRITNMIKTLRGLDRLPRPLPVPGGPANSFGNNVTEKEKQVRKEAYSRAIIGRADKSTVAFFAEPYTFEARD